jgi:hypothetical protein
MDGRGRWIGWHNLRAALVAYFLIWLEGGSAVGTLHGWYPFIISKDIFEIHAWLDL